MTDDPTDHVYRSGPGRIGTVRRADADGVDPARIGHARTGYVRAVNYLVQAAVPPPTSTYDLRGVPVTLALDLDDAATVTRADLVLNPAPPSPDVDPDPVLPEPAAVAERRVAAPGYLTLATLRELGSCGEYLRRFGDLFPPSRYPTGVSITRELCERHAHDFDWSWAASVMLSDRARATWNDLRTARTAVARAFGTGHVKRAALFGHLFEADDANRSDAYRHAVSSAEERVAERALRDLDRCRTEVDQARAHVDRWTRALADAEARLPALEAAAGPALRRRAAARAARLTADVAALEARLVEARRAAAAATAEAAGPEDTAAAAAAPPGTSP